MRQTDNTGIIDGFYDSDDATEEPIESKAPRFTDFGKTFLSLPTDFTAPSGHRTAFVVSEVRTSYGRTQRRVVGVFDSKRDAERKAAEIRHVLVRFLERHNGRPFGDELCGGTLLQYWHAGNPLSIVGFAVTVEEAASWVVG